MTRKLVVRPRGRNLTAAARELAEDSVWLGRAEGLEAHARAAERR